MNWNFTDFLNLAGSLIISIGGAGVLIIGLSKYFGDNLAKALLQKHKFSHEKDLEEIKSKYSTELETTKNELEKSKALFHRYSEKQFELYNNLWKLLWRLKKQADDLWEEADPKLLPKFSKLVYSVEEAANINILIIEDNHYKQLISLVSKFQEFEFGKKQLISLRNKSAHQIEESGLNQQLVRNVIMRNGNIKSDYDKLIMDIAQSFKNQISA